jgi:hypothetical protein
VQQEQTEYTLTPNEEALIEELKFALQATQHRLEGAIKMVIRSHELDPVATWNLVGRTLVKQGSGSSVRARMPGE